jgi:hypothetical protein
MSYRSSSSSSNSRSSIAPRPPSFGSNSSHRSSVSGSSAPSRKPASSGSVTPVCVHCRNLGLEFDHWLRKSPEPDSPVVCPVLLATECRYCHELGHTVGGCPAKKRSMARQNSSSYASVPFAVPFVVPLPVVPSPSDITKTVVPVRSNNAYSAFDTSSDSGSDNGSLTSVPSNISKKRVDVGALFASKNTKDELIPSYATAGKRVDVGSLFSPVPMTTVESRSITYEQTELGEDGLHEKEYNWTTYGDPEVDRMVAERRALFASGRSWADIEYDSDYE